MARKKQVTDPRETRMHPDAKAWLTWLESEEGVSLSSGTASSVYLKNRLWRAFMAGIEHGRNAQQEEARADAVVKDFVKGP